MLQLPIPLLFGLTIVTCWISSLQKGIYTKRIPSHRQNLGLFQLLQNVSCLVTLVVVLYFSGGFGSFSPFSLGLGVLIGIASQVSLHCGLLAFSIGPFSYTSLITTVLAVIIPTLSGLFIGESISGPQWLGILLMVVCIYLSVDRNNDAREGKATAKWLIACAVSGLASGMVGIIQKAHQSAAAYSHEIPALLITCFAIASIASAVTVLTGGKQAKQSPPPAGEKPRLSELLIPMIGGVAFAFPNIINLFLSGKAPAVIVFPLINLGPLLLSMVAAMILFRERLTALRWVGVAIGFLSMLLTSGTIG